MCARKCGLIGEQVYSIPRATGKGGDRVKLTVQEKELVKIRNLLEMHVLKSPAQNSEYAKRVKDSIERAEKEA